MTEESTRQTSIHVGGDVDKSALIVGDNNTVTINLGDVYKPYLVGLITDLTYIFKQEPYVSLSGYTTVLPPQYRDIAHGQGEIIEHHKNLFDVFKTYSQFVLLGDPGSGKTHTLKYMALQAAKRCLQTNFQSPLPLLIDLSSWDKELTFEDFLSNYWKSRKKLSGDPFQLITQGAVLLFLDGLNEMGEMGKEHVESINQWLLSLESPNTEKIFFSCKKNDYLNKDLNLEIKNFPKVFITRLSDEQISQFANVYSKNPEQFLNQFIDKQTGDSLRLPYTLSRSVILHDRHVKYVSNPGTLNHILVKSLWRRETERKNGGLKNADDGDENDNTVFFMLGQLAVRLFVEQKPLSFDAKFAIDTFATAIALASSQGKSAQTETQHLEHAENILADALQLGLLISDDSKTKFPHQLLYEYFIARRLWRARHMGASYPFEEVEYKDEESLITLDFTNRYFSGFDSIFIQLFGIVATANEKELDILIYEILKISNNPFLAADCIASTGFDISPVFRRIIVYELTQKYLFVIFGQPKDDDFPFSAQHLDTLRSALKSGSIQFGMFPSVTSDFSLYISKILDDSCFDFLVGLIGNDILIDQGIMLGLALSGKSGLDFFVNTLNDESYDYFVRSRIARCVLEFPPEKKYVEALQKLVTNKVHTLGDKGIMLGRLTIGKLAEQKLAEINAFLS